MAPDGRALSHSVWHVTFHIILMKMAFMMAAFCEPSKGSHNKIAAFEIASLMFNCVTISQGHRENEAKFSLPSKNSTLIFVFYVHTELKSVQF